jgi:hypothetical protein
MQQPTRRYGRAFSAILACALMLSGAIGLLPVRPTEAAPPTVGGHAGIPGR